MLKNTAIFILLILILTGAGSLQAISDYAYKKGNIQDHLKNLESKSAEIRKEAAGRLAAFEDSADEIVPVLSEYLFDANEEVRDQVRESIGQLLEHYSNKIIFLKKSLKDNRLTLWTLVQIRSCINNEDGVYQKFADDIDRLSLSDDKNIRLISSIIICENKKNPELSVLEYLLANYPEPYAEDPYEIEGVLRCVSYDTFEPEYIFNAIYVLQKKDLNVFTRDYHIKKLIDFRDLQKARIFNLKIVIEIIQCAEKEYPYKAEWLCSELVSSADFTDFITFLENYPVNQTEDRRKLAHKLLLFLEEYYKVVMNPYEKISENVQDPFKPEGDPWAAVEKGIPGAAEFLAAKGKTILAETESRLKSGIAERIKSALEVLIHLGENGKSLQTLAEQFTEHQNPGIRLRALAAALRLGCKSKQVRDACQTALDSSYPWQKLIAADILAGAGVGDPDLIEKINKMTYTWCKPKTDALSLIFGYIGPNIRENPEILTSWLGEPLGAWKKNTLLRIKVFHDNLTMESRRGLAAAYHPPSTDLDYLKRLDSEQRHRLLLLAEAAENSLGYSVRSGMKKIHEYITKQDKTGTQKGG